MIIVGDKFGQLGNRLLRAAHLIAAAEEFGVTFADPTFDEYAEFFCSTLYDPWCRYPNFLNSGSSQPTPVGKFHRLVASRLIRQTSRVMSRCGLRRFPIHYISIDAYAQCDVGSDEFGKLATSRKPLLLAGFLFRSDKLLEKHSDLVRAHFRILPTHRRAVDSIVANARQAGSLLIGIHIRHGDYADWDNGRYYYPTEKYAKMMTQIVTALSDHHVRFLVCGNGNLSVRQFENLDVHFSSGHLVEDMYALAEVDLIIGPPSTFSGWAAFYGNKPLRIMQTAKPSIHALDLDCAIKGTEETQGRWRVA